jgi:hypothetical protein
MELTGFSGLALERSGSGVIFAVIVLLVVLMSHFFGCGLRPVNIDRVQAFGTLDDLEVDRLPGFEGFVTLHRDRRVMSKQVLVLAIFNDEAIPLGVVKPLDLTA